MIIYKIYDHPVGKYQGEATVHTRGDSVPRGLCTWLSLMRYLYRVSTESPRQVPPGHIP